MLIILIQRIQKQRMILQKKCIFMINTGNKSTRDKSFVRLPKSPAIMILGITPATNKLSSDIFKFGKRIKMSLQGKQARNISNIIKKTLALLDKLLEHNANRWKFTDF